MQQPVYAELLNIPDSQKRKLNLSHSEGCRTYCKKFLLTGNLNLARQWHMNTSEELINPNRTVSNLTGTELAAMEKHVSQVNSPSTLCPLNQHSETAKLMKLGFIIIFHAVKLPAYRKWN